MTATVAYLTKRFPRLSETFILDEILGLEAAGVPLRLYAIADPHEKLVQPDVARVKSEVVYLQRSGSWGDRWDEYRATMVAHAQLCRESPKRYLGIVAYIARRRRHLSTVKNFAQAGRLAALLRADDTRHLHAAFAHGPASVAHFVHLLTGIPYSFSAHAKDIYVSAPDLLARKLRDASFVLSCSESARNALTSLAGADAAKVILANHGVDTQRFTSSQPVASPGADGSPLRVLAVGRLVAKKGYPVLLGALKIMNDAGHAVRCTIVGEGTDREQLVALVAELGLTATVQFVGSQTHQEVAERFHHADVFVQASVVLANGDRDGIPNSLLEAMASGLAVVASDVAGIPEVVTPACGLLVPPGDSGALAVALERLGDDAALRARLGDRARAHVVEKFDRTACAMRIAPLFGVDTVSRPEASSEPPARRVTPYVANREG
jgi:glycosyltransferase involved in cell wall biosynthesis